MVIAFAPMLAAVAGIALLVRFNETNRLRNDQAHVWRAVVCSIEDQVLRSQDATWAQQRRALRFYDHLLVDDVHTAPCNLPKEQS